MRKGLWLCFLFIFVLEPTAEELNLTAEGYDSRIDLRWQGREGGRYYVYRTTNPDGPFELLNRSSHGFDIYSDFTGENDKTYYYRVRPLEDVTGYSNTASATSKAMNEEELLTSVQEATFRYFWDYGHPVSGLARERQGSGDTVTTGGSGFGMMTIMVASERGFVTREEAAQRILTIVAFLEDKAERYHGVWSHHLNGETGKTIPFAGQYDNGGDLVETSFLMQGMLTVRNYFDQDNDVENEIRERITRLWHEVEWDWYLRYPDGKQLYWHWSPDYEWQMNHPIGGHFNEAMITYILAIASPSHAIPPESYYEGWTGNPPNGYVNENDYYGHTLWVGWPLGGPLFFTHYSYLGFDPRGKRDKYCNYFENNRNHTLINRAYCIDNPRNHEGYSELVWGLTASDTPGGYVAHDPNHDIGTITPTAAISAMPYTPQESIATLKHFYYEYGNRLWGEFGFHDAFNLEEDWFANSYLAIDQGTIVPMIENYRTGLCWEMFMRNEEIIPALEAIGWTIEEPTSVPLKIDTY